MKKNIFLLLTILGFIAPYYFFFQFVITNGYDMPLLLQQVFANNISSAFAVDLIVSIIVFWVYVFAEATRLRMKYPWFYLLVSLIIGLSFALPLFLYFRELTLEEK